MPGTISDAISQSSVFVLIFSDFSNRSRQVIREVELAVSRGVVVIPLRLEDVPLSSTMEYYVGTCHWLDALTPPLEAHLNRLRSRIQSLLQPADLEAHEASPSQPATTAQSEDTALETPTPVSATYRAAIQRRLDARRQHRKARLAIGAGALLLVLTLAIALSFGLKAHEHGPASDTGGAGAAQGGPAADTLGLAPAQDGPAADPLGPGPAQGGPAADTGGPGAAQGQPAAVAGGPSPAQVTPEGNSEGTGEAYDTAVLSSPSPTFSQASVQVKRCAGQLKALARAIQMYSMDYDERLPRADWAPATYPYAIREYPMRNYQLYTCPAAPGASGYALNRQALGQNIAFIHQPAQTALLFDSSANVPSAVEDSTGMAYRHPIGDQLFATVAYVAGNVRCVHRR